MILIHYFLHSRICRFKFLSNFVTHHSNYDRKNEFCNDSFVFLKQVFLKRKLLLASADFQNRWKPVSRKFFAKSFEKREFIFLNTQELANNLIDRTEPPDEEGLLLYLNKEIKNR